MPISFHHRQSAHCESGVTSNLLTHHGLPLSEAMAFGIGAGLLFGYFPFIKINKLPLVTFRSAPGSIFKRVTGRLGIRVERQSFKDPQPAMTELDRKVVAGIPVGLQTGVYWLPYFPPALRFHFNAHNLVVYGIEGMPTLSATRFLASRWFVPVPIWPGPASPRERSRPRGKCIALPRCRRTLTWRRPCARGCGKSARVMVKAPLPLIGTWGIRTLAAAVEKWPARLGTRMAILHLGHIIRMQEEIGTGGGGFRFIYAAFLQEAAGVLGDARYLDLSRRMTAIGDTWREFALAGARHCKGRAGAHESFSDLADILRSCAELETALFRDLDDLTKP